jgi:hypothetical protein
MNSIVDLRKIIVFFMTSTLVLKTFFSLDALAIMSKESPDQTIVLFLPQSSLE